MAFATLPLGSSSPPAFGHCEAAFFDGGGNCRGVLIAVIPDDRPGIAAKIERAITETGAKSISSFGFAASDTYTRVVFVVGSAAAIAEIGRWANVPGLPGSAQFLGRDDWSSAWTLELDFPAASDSVGLMLAACSQRAINVEFERTEELVAADSGLVFSRVVLVVSRDHELTIGTVAELAAELEIVLGGTAAFYPGVCPVRS